jgi:uncharacterized protein (TIGR03435 family)
MRMTKAIPGTILVACAGWLAFGQTGEPLPKFEAADIHPSAKSLNAFPRSSQVRNGRFEVKNATMVDLIRMAYGFDPDKVVGGPNWLELDRFDVAAKVPAVSTSETQKPMLQTLLEDRFKLVVRKETRPLPTHALTVGKKPQIKEAEGTEEAGCHPKTSSGTSGPGGVMLTTMDSTGKQTTIALGPGMTVQMICRNMTMEAFASSLRSMFGANLGSNPIRDETGLKGAFNFDLSYSMQMIGPMPNDTGERISISTALEKQLGLKLEERQVPTPVLVVESVNRKPSENPPGTADALPPVAVPTEFEVASVKPTDPGFRMGRYMIQPGGRVVIEGMTLRFLLSRAFNTFNDDAIAGVPAFANGDRYDIAAKAGGGLGPADMEATAPMMLNLLKERFKLQYHTEDRPVQAYALVASKPKLKKADPNSRIYCRNANAPPGSPPGSRTLTCQNVTMALFAERLQNAVQGLGWPVRDATELAGSWDLSFTFSARSMPIAPPPPRMGDAGPTGAPVPTASDPTGTYTIFEAIEKQLGLKLEKEKRNMPVIVIDHLEQKPTEN